MKNKCDDNCLNCKLEICVLDKEDDEKVVNTSDKRKYNNAYYRKNRASRIESHRKWYQAHREEHLTRAKNYYNANRELISQRRKEQRRLKRMTNKERIRALMGNLKNWTWEVSPQFRIEKEDAIALQDKMALKEYFKEQEEFEKRKKGTNV